MLQNMGDRSYFEERLEFGVGAWLGMYDNRMLVADGLLQ